MGLLDAGDADGHDQLIAEAASDLPAVDVILLAQFSMARSRPLVASQSSVPVLTAPDTAVAKLRKLVGDSTNA